MNPLLSRAFIIPFDQIRAEHIEAGIREALQQAEIRLQDLVYSDVCNYETILGGLDELEERLGRSISISHHLLSTRNSPEMRSAYNAVLPEFSAFYAKLPLNTELWQAIKAYAATDEAQSLPGTRKRHLEKTMREFQRWGADLPAAEKARLEVVNVELNQLQARFSENVLDATNAFELVITDSADLSGLPESAVQAAQADAEARGQEGYRFTLQMPSFLPFIQYADNRELRKQLYQAYNDRAAGGDFDNRAIIVKLLSLRQELAGLLGFDSFADFKMQDRMVKSAARAHEFEEELYAKTLPYWQEEIAGLTSFARSLGIHDLEAWDVAYVTEKLRKARFDLDEEALRPYFPLALVLEGLFGICSRLFGLSIVQKDNPHVWHDDVVFYEVYRSGVHIGSFYADFFPREDKRSGAWMNSFITGGPSADGFEPHLGLMCANFSKPQGDKPALLTHREVETTFHEFGHLLHHLLSNVDVRARAGTNVAWDWVELPSQILENWCWEREALDLFARHYQTGEPIPEALYQKLLASRTFMQANAQMRQLSFGTVDLKLHMDYQAEQDGDVVAYAQQVMSRFTIQPHFAQTNFIASFSHIFAGAYAAGYYSYKWSEVLEADAFSRFRQEGIFNEVTGRDFVDAVLSRGDSEDPAVLFREFMGRDPDVNALLERNLGRVAGVTG